MISMFAAFQRVLYDMHARGYTPGPASGRVWTADGWLNCKLTSGNVPLEKTMSKQVLPQAEKRREELDQWASEGRVRRDAPPSPTITSFLLSAGSPDMVTLGFGSVRGVLGSRPGMRRLFSLVLAFLTLGAGYCVCSGGVCRS